MQPSEYGQYAAIVLAHADAEKAPYHVAAAFESRGAAQDDDIADDRHRRHLEVALQLDVAVVVDGTNSVERVRQHLRSQFAVQARDYPPDPEIGRFQLEASQPPDATVAIEDG
jgi:hypothetical protein